MKKKLDPYSVAVSLMVLLFILAMGILFIIIPDRSFSETENRTLAGAPSISLKGLSSGDFARDFETYLADQFPGRDLLVKLKTATDLVAGRSELGGVYAARDAYLIEDVNIPSPEAMSGLSDGFSALKAAFPDLNYYFLLAPTAATVHRDLLPVDAPCADESALMDQYFSRAVTAGFTPVDVRDTLLAHSDDYLYYRTDHHWTTESAWLSYRVFAEKAGFDPDAAAYEPLAISDTFNGTLAAASGLEGNVRDVITAYFPVDESQPAANYLVEYVSEKQRVTSFYDTDRLETRDQYAVFFSGNHSLVRILSTCPEDRRLLVIKDSYANCFLPFLAQHYRRIDVVDPRYFYDDLATLITVDEPQDVLFLYNANTLFADTALAGLLGQIG